MNRIAVCAAALLIGSSVYGYAAPKGVGDSGGIKGASQFAPGHYPKGTRGASTYAPGHQVTTGRGHSESSPGDKMNDLRRR
jgi:hypothetical protein